MQVLLALIAVGSTAWLAVDASKRDWTDSKVAKNVPTWVVGSLLVWPIVFPLYVFSERKKAPLLAGAEPEPEKQKAPTARAEPEPERAAAMATPPPSEAFGPSLDEVAESTPIPDPLALMDVEQEPVVEMAAPEPVVELSAPEPVVEIASEPEPEPIVEIEPEPEPVIELSAPEATVEIEPEAPAVDWAALAAADQETVGDDEPLERSVPEEAPSGLSMDAFEHIKPVSFGGAEPVDAEPALEAPLPEPEPEVVLEPEPVMQLDPVEPLVQPEPEPAPTPETETKKRGSKFNPEVKLPGFGKRNNKAKPAPAPLTDDELVVLEVLTEMGQLSAEEMGRELEGGTLEEIEATLHALTRKQRAEAAPHPAGTGLRYSVAAEEQPESAKKKGGKFNPEIKLPKLSFSKKKSAAPKEPTPASAKPASAKRGFITLPPQLQGPLNDLERKIVLGSVVTIVAAAALGYTSAPQDDSGGDVPTPAAASR